MDGNVNASNVNFYTTLFSGQSFGGLIIRECGESRVTWIDDEVTWTGTRLLPENDNENQTFSGTFTWRNKAEPDIFDEPANIFST